MIDFASQLKKLNYEFSELSDSVFLIKNFFEDKDILPIWNLINNSTQDHWEGAYRKSQELLALKKFNRTDIDNLIEEGLMEYTYSWSDKNINFKNGEGDAVNKKLHNLFSFTDELYISDFEGVQRQYSGVDLLEHVDGDAHPQIEYAAIAYINDDYNGGEVFFSKLGLEFKPPKNSLLIFANGLNYIHGVREVLDGPTRYVLPTFIYHYV